MDTFVDLFCGVGGLSLGLGLANFQAVAATDAWDDAAATYRKNHPGVAFALAPIEELSKPRLSALVPTRPDWVVGGPPCQGYSTVGKRLRTDDRNRLFLEFVRVIKHLRPDGFILENVLGLKDMKFTDEVASVFAEQGFAVAALVVSAADFGVPQLRRRVIFVGHRNRGFFVGPWSETSIKPVSVADAIFDLPELPPGGWATEYAGPPLTEYQATCRRGSRLLQGHRASRHPARLVRAIAHIPDGGNRTAIPPELQPPSGFHNSYSRLASWLPAVAVTQNMGKPSTSRCIHPVQNRGLTTREGARLQSFPDRFHFVGADTSQRLQVANAVPPELARRLARSLCDERNWSVNVPASSRVGKSYNLLFTSPSVSQPIVAVQAR